MSNTIIIPYIIVCPSNLLVLSFRSDAASYNAPRTTTILHRIYCACLSNFVPLSSRWGGGTKRKLIRGGFAPRSDPLPFIYHFWQKTYPFRIPFVFRLGGINVSLNVTFKANKTQAIEIERTLTNQGIQIVLKEAVDKMK